MKKPTFPLKSNLKTYTKKFCSGWTQEDFHNEYLKIVTHISTLTKSQRNYVLSKVKKNETDNTNK